MKKTHIIILIAALALMVPAYAQQNGDEYVIQKDDTLWDISNSRLEDPFLWPKLWNVNPHINNPDLIYPGERIVIPSRDELMKMITPPAAATESTASPQRTAIKPSKSSPAAADRAEKTAAGKHVKYLIDKNRYMSLGWIAETYPAIGKITSTPSGRELTGREDIVYVDISAAKLLSSIGLQDKPSLIVARDDNAKNRYLIIRNVKTVKHPVSGDKLGYLIRVTGLLETIGTDSKTTKARIIRSFEDIQTGDGLIPYKETDPPVAPATLRNPAIDAYIIESLFSKELSAEGDIVFIDRGQNDGLQAGDVLSVFSDSQVERVIGDIQIVSLQPTTSTALIVRSDTEITSGLKLGQK